MATILSLVLVVSAQAQDVQTLGGGPVQGDPSPFGFRDGDTLQNSQFNQPFGLAFNIVNQLFVADRANNAIRHLNVAGNTTTTVIRDLQEPVDLHFDLINNLLYILEAKAGRIIRYDSFLRFDRVIVEGLQNPTAFALNSLTNLYIVEQGGNLKRANVGGGPPVLIRSGLNQPQGVAVASNGNLIVGEAGAHRIQILQPQSGLTLLTVGTGVPGHADGPADSAQFNAPHKIAALQDGSFVVADRLNHRVRLVSNAGVAFTIYGIDPSLWGECSSCYPGWVDGELSVAEAREPVGVAISAANQLFVSENYYHLIRTFNGALDPGTFPGSGGGPGVPGGGFVIPPFITPHSGFFPDGVEIVVKDFNSDSFLSRVVYYTTDGSEPTTNSFRVNMTNDTGVIVWNESSRDLSALRIKTFLGTESSETTPGLPVSTNLIGIARNVVAGPGSQIVVPVSMSLKPDQVLKSLQFRLELKPLNGAPAVMADEFHPITSSTNDFVTLLSPGEGTQFTSFYETYSVGNTRGIIYGIVGSLDAFTIEGFFVPVLARIPIPRTASYGDEYEISVLQASGTSDGFQNEVEFEALSPKRIRIQAVRFLVGDSAPGHWYNAEESFDHGGDFLGFGDGELNNADVNNALNASLGLRVPFPFTDIYQAMDAYPEDSAVSVGGDGEIRFLDWAIIQDRSLNLRTEDWVRYWDESGDLKADSFEQRVPSNLPGDTWVRQYNENQESSWYRPVMVSAGGADAIEPGRPLSLPVYAHILENASLSGMQFMVDVSGTVPLESPITFQPMVASGQFFRPTYPLPANQTGGAWPLGSFQPPLEGIQQLGVLNLHIPASARAGDTLLIQFKALDGSPEPVERYDFQSASSLLTLGEVLVVSPLSQLISDEWRIRFFGNLTSDNGKAGADPDGDGQPNWMEFRAGTDPNLADSHLALRITEPDPFTTLLEWFGARGRSYVVECSSNLSEWQTVAEGILGNDGIQRLTINDPNNTTQFYRLKLTN